jgi:hypothetical protein
VIDGWDRGTPFNDWRVGGQQVVTVEPQNNLQRDPNRKDNERIACRIDLPNPHGMNKHPDDGEYPAREHCKQEHERPMQ